MSNLLLTPALKIILILITAFVVRWFLKVSTLRVMRKIVKIRPSVRDGIGVEQRIKTLTSIIVNTGSIVLMVIAGLMIFSELGLNITPILTGAGILGLAVGFGSQSLVKDAINGLFILLEDQYVEGDEVEIKGIQGRVKEITLRRTILLDSKGVEHSIPNSQIQIVSNLTKGGKKKPVV